VWGGGGGAGGSYVDRGGRGGGREERKRGCPLAILTSERRSVGVGRGHGKEGPLFGLGGWFSVSFGETFQGGKIRQTGETQSIVGGEVRKTVGLVNLRESCIPKKN